MSSSISDSNHVNTLVFMFLILVNFKKIFYMIFKVDCLVHGWVCGLVSVLQILSHANVYHVLHFTKHNCTHDWPDKCTVSSTNIQSPRAETWHFYLGKRNTTRDVICHFWREKMEQGPTSAISHLASDKILISYLFLNTNTNIIFQKMKHKIWTWDIKIVGN
jgi:hypothetical protein